MASQRIRKPALPIQEYTVGWISALPIEAAAACEMLDEEHEDLPSDSDDPAFYTLGRIGNHAVVIGGLPAGRIGTTPAAVIAARMMNKFPSIRFGLMVGIGGGNPTKEDIRLGDVVVSQPQGRYGGVVQYNMGKETLQGFEETGQLNAPPEVLLGALGQAQREFFRGRSRHSQYLSEIEEKNPRFHRAKAGQDILYRLIPDSERNSEEAEKGLGVEEVERAPRDADDLVHVHFGTIASDNIVIKNANVRDDLSKRLGGILCFEMEAAGLMNTFPCLVIRGICDYADAHKNKKWQPYAAATAAAYGKEILSFIQPRKIADMKPIKAPWTVPFVKNNQFTGRSTILDRLNCCLDNSSSHPYVSIHGLGGCGKSAVAIEFAHQAHERHNCAVFWVSAFDKLRFEQSYRAIAEALQMPEASDPNKNILTLVQQRLNQYDRVKWLMIVDNFDQADVLWDRNSSPDGSPTRLWNFLPQNQDGMILFTTRTREIAVQAAPNDYYPLGGMGPSEAVELVKSSLQNQPTPPLIDTVKQFCESLTYLPLAIIQALAFMKINNTPLQRYLQLLRATDQSMVELLKEPFEDATRDVKSHNAVVATWLLSFRHLQEGSPQASKYLYFLACIAPQNIPRSIFPLASTELEQVKALGVLTGYAFLNERENSNHYDVHPLIHRVTQSWLKDRSLWMQVIRQAIEWLNQVTPYGGHKRSSEYRSYLSHGLFAGAFLK